MTGNNFTPSDEMCYRLCHVVIFIGWHISLKRVINIDDTDMEKEHAIFRIIFPSVCGGKGGVQLCGWD